MPANRQKLLLKNNLSPGDIIMLTSAVRDLYIGHPGRYVIDVDTSCKELWENNPYITKFDHNAPDVKVIQCEYPVINISNTVPLHFIHAFRIDLELKLRHPILPTRFKGDLHLSEREKTLPSGIEAKNYWILVAGGKSDFTAKWWSPIQYQKVVDHFRGKITFVQLGRNTEPDKNGAYHWQPKLDGVIDLVNMTSLRDFLRLMYHSAGVVCPVTFAMHAAAALPCKPDMPINRACVVVAGSREPSHWEAYPHHRYLSNNGALPCSPDGGCWVSRCQPVAGESKSMCEAPVQISPTLSIPKCMDMITADDVIRAIETYYIGGSLSFEK